jgi:hypothetical protein
MEELKFKINFTKEAKIIILLILSRDHERSQYTE